MLLITQIKMMAGCYLQRRGWRKGPIGGADLHTAMSRRSEISVNTVIDVGASNGQWSDRAMRYLPNASYLLVEAQETTYGSALKQFKRSHSKVDFALCAAGDHDGQIYFDASNPLGGAASTTPFERNNIVVQMRAIDTLVKQYNLSGPFLMKLDTHGFELQILDGAKETLSQSAMLIIEAYNFTLRPGCVRFYELCKSLELLGFRCVDMFDLMVRPVDNVLWQMDLVFLPSTHPVFELNGYDFGERGL